MNALVRARQAAQADIRLALRRRRRALGLTQEQAGRLLGMSRLTYQKPIFPNAVSNRANSRLNVRNRRREMRSPLMS